MGLPNRNIYTNQKMKLAFATLAGLAASRNLNSDFQSFKNKYAKLYSPVEESRRFNIWKENMAFVERHNRDSEAGLETYTVSMNEFADLTNAEFHTRYLAMTQDSAQIRLNYQCPVDFVDNGSGVADSVDWRTTANPQSTVAVTSVKDQGSCGSCWSFGGAAAFESAMCLDGQQDCSSWSIAAVKITPLWDHTTIWLVTVVGSTTLCTTSKLLATLMATTTTHTSLDPPNKPETASLLLTTL